VFTDVQTHYDLLIEEGNDPVHDPIPLHRLSLQHMMNPNFSWAHER
jgi:hypothetical protein